MLRFAIEQETPYQVLIAATGREALDTLHMVKPDVILLDYFLSDMNGLQVYEQLRAIPGCEAVPVVLVTATMAKAIPNNTQLPLLEKPFDLDTFFEILHHHLEPM